MREWRKRRQNKNNTGERKMLPAWEDVNNHLSRDCLLTPALFVLSGFLRIIAVINAAKKFPAFILIPALLASSGSSVSGQLASSREHKLTREIPDETSENE